MGARQPHGFLAAAGLHGRVAMGLQQIVEELHIQLIVFHDHHGLGHADFRSRPEQPDRIYSQSYIDEMRMVGAFVKTQTRGKATNEWAQGLAIEALGFLASDIERLEPFLSLTGIDIANLRQVAADPAFLIAVLDHLASDETLLLAFAANAGHDPTDIDRARQMLAGPQPDWGA